MDKFCRLDFGQATGSPITLKSRPRNSEYIPNTGCSVTSSTVPYNSHVEGCLCEEHSLLILIYKTALIAESYLVIRYHLRWQLLNYDCHSLNSVSLLPARFEYEQVRSKANYSSNSHVSRRERAVQGVLPTNSPGRPTLHPWRADGDLSRDYHRGRQSGKGRM